MKLGMEVSEGKVRSPYFFALLSSITAVVTKLADAYITRNFFAAESTEEKIVGAFVFLTLGGLIGSVVFFIIAHSPFGKVLDPRYRGFRLGTCRLQVNALIGGVSGAVSTGFYLFALQKGYDAAALVALGSSQILWTMGYEYMKSRVSVHISEIALPAVLLIAGILVGEWRGIPSFEVFVLVFVLSAFLAGISEVHDKVVAEESDATLATVWRFIYLGASATFLSIAFVWHIGKVSLYRDVLYDKWYIVLLPIAVLMIFSFFTNGCAARAKAHLDMGASKVMLISNLKIVGVLFALVVLNLVLGYSEFGELPTDPFVLVRKTLGAVIITASVIWLVKSKKHTE